MGSGAVRMGGWFPSETPNVTALVTWGKVLLTPRPDKRREFMVLRGFG